ncbi:reverse transcriptase domain-containing protein [Tanacetum coccineum]
MESVSFQEPPPLIGTPEKQNLNKFCDYHEDMGHNTNDYYQLKKQIKEVLASRKLAHLVKDIRRNNQRNGSQGRNNVKVINMIRGWGSRKRSFKGERSGLTDELTFPAIPRNQLTDEPIILEGMIVGHQTKKMQNSAGRFLRRNVPPSGNNRPLSNHGKGRKEQNSANGVCYNKMSFVVQRHNRKDRNEKPQSVEKLCGNVDSWKGCKVRGMRRETGIEIKGVWLAEGRDDQKGSTPREGEELASLMEYSYKCFLRLPKEYNQIRMAKNDEEKTGFHTEEGVYCFTHMPEGLKNSVETLQRMMEKFIPKLAELKYPINKVRVRMDAAAGSGWTNEAEEAFQRIKIKLNKLQTLAIPKEGEKLMLCMRQRNEMISSVLMVEREGAQTHVSYKSEGSVVKKFFGQGEQVQKTLGIILVSPDEKMHLYAIRLKFNASDHAMDCEALLAGLVASVNKGMKDLHVFIDSLTLVAQIEGNHTPAMEHEGKYKEEIMDATALFHRFRITHLSKILNSKAEMLTRLATIKLEFLNQEVSVGIKTRPSVEEITGSKKEKAANNVPGTKPNYNWETSASN